MIDEDQYDKPTSIDSIFNDLVDNNDSSKSNEDYISESDRKKYMVDDVNDIDDATISDITEDDFPKEFDPLTEIVNDNNLEEADKTEETAEPEQFDSTDELINDDVSESIDPTEKSNDSDKDVSDDEPVYEILDDMKSDDLSNDNNVDSSTYSVEDSESKDIPVEEKPIEKEHESIKEETIADKTAEIPDEKPEEKEKIEEHSDIKAGDAVDSANDLKDFMIESFNKRVDEVLSKYTKDDVINYINKFKNDGKNKNIISDMHSTELLHYADYIDFQHDEEAMTSLWIIVGGKFADYIEQQKSEGKIDSSVEVINHGKVDDGIIEDPYLTDQLKHKHDNEDKYEQYKLDRTVFAIANEEEDDECSIFDDKKTLEKDFFDSPFYSILAEVMESDRICDMNKIKMKVIINADTSYIPVVDFNTGIRLICIDTNDVDQYHIHALMISRKIPFSFGKEFNFRVRMLYSDNCKERPVATVFALRKLIGYKYIKDKRKVNISGNYVIAYTTEPKFIDMFEKGDVDSKMPENSTYYCSKPHNKAIGIIILDKKSERDRQAMRRNQIRMDTNQQQEVSVNDYDIHFVLSAEYICNDKRLVDPTIPQDQRHVQYVITQYNECNPVIIMDGLQTICACIIKEHYAKYGRGTKYSIEFECDRSNLLTPGVLKLIDDHNGLELSTYRNSGPMEIVRTFTLPPSRLKLDGVFSFERGRVERRFMSPSTITSHYPRELTSNYDLSTNDGVCEFLKSRGFEEFWEPSMIVYDVMPYVLNIIETGSMISELHKISLSSLADRNSSDKDALLFEQEKLEYFKKLDKENVGGFQRFLFGIIDMFISGEFN